MQRKSGCYIDSHGIPGIIFRDLQKIAPMKKGLILLLGAWMLLGFTGCSSVKRFKSASFKHEDPALVEVDLFSTKLTEEESGPGGGNLWDLSAGAQTQFVQILDERFPENSRFIEALGTKYPGKEIYGASDLTEKNLRMVFSIRKKRDYARINDPSGRFSPADRIEYLTIRLDLPDTSHLHFTRWNRFSTEYGEIEIADITFSRNLQLEPDVPVAEAELSPRATVGRNEMQEVRARYLKLNGAMDDGWILIEEEGTRETDLTGNVLADITLRFEPFPERITHPVFAPAGLEHALQPELKGWVFREVMVPRMEEAPERIMGTLRADYVYRHVQSGWKTFQEWDDRVEYYSGTLEKEVVLFSRKDYLPDFFCIGTDQSGRRVLTLRHTSGREYPLQFDNYPDASSVLEWLMNRTAPGPAAIGAYTLIFEGIPFEAGMRVGETGLKVLPVY